MEKVSFHRRPFFILFVLTLFAAALAVFLFGRITDPGLPGLVASLILLLAIPTLLGLILFTFRFAFSSTADPRATISTSIRLFLLFIWLLAHIQFISPVDDSIALQSALLLLDLVLITLIPVLVLTSQFVLPVGDLQDRLDAFLRLLGHTLGERGPVSFVRDGTAIEAVGERSRRGSGVIIIDYASAVVLRTDTAFTRAVGPGIVFTEPGEWLAEAVDLRRQEYHIKGSIPIAGKEHSPESLSSMAITRDGIPVSADLSITFMIDPGHLLEPREGRTADTPPYEVNLDAVERAVYGHVFSSYEEVSWEDLPLLLLVDLWREEMKQWSLNALLESDRSQIPPLEQITGAIRAQIVPSMTEAPSADRVETGQESRELGILNSRGIRVLDLNVMDLQLPPEIQNERNLQWRESWAGEVQETLREATDRLRKNRELGEVEANLLLSRGITSTLLGQFEAGKRPDAAETLEMILTDAISLYEKRDLLPESSGMVNELEQITSKVSGRE
jgi:regulator of protease activity HflC (stomatin/prohibitin superfamily)